MADYGQQSVAANKLLPEKDLCFRVGKKAAGEKRFSESLADMPGRYWKYGTYRLAVMGLEKDPLNQGADLLDRATRYNPSSWVLKRPLELKGLSRMGNGRNVARHGS